MNAAMSRKRNDTPDDPGPPLLAGTNEWDDDQPYPVPGTGTRPCPHCRKDLPLSATFCVHCGKDLKTGEKSKRRFEPIQRTWSEGWSFSTRAMVLAGVFLLDLVIVGSTMFANGDILFGLAGMLMNMALQTFILGTFSSIAVKRTSQGKATITISRRVGFVKLPPERVDWRESQAVGTVPTHEGGLAWFFCIYLLFLGVLPGVLFYWFVLHPEKCDVTLCDIYGSTNLRLYRASSVKEGAEVAETISTATGLAYRKVV